MLCHKPLPVSTRETCKREKKKAETFVKFCFVIIDLFVCVRMYTSRYKHGDEMNCQIGSLSPDMKKLHRLESSPPPPPPQDNNIIAELVATTSGSSIETQSAVIYDDAVL